MTHESVARPLLFRSRMDSVTYFILVLFLAPCIAHAFINIEELRLQKDQGGSGSVNLKMEGRSGNTQKLAGEVASLNMIRNEQREYILVGKYRYGESRNTKDEHEGNLHARYTKHFTGRPSLETFVQTEFNEFRSLKRRDLLGGGARFAIHNTPELSLACGTGAFYENELFKAAPWREDTVRANFYVSYVRKTGPKSTASAIAYYQPSLEHLNDRRLQADLGFSSAITDKLALILDGNVVYDSDPPAGVKPTDTTYMAGFTWNY